VVPERFGSAMIRVLLKGGEDPEVRIRQRMAATPVCF
jgi:hypothetical protein